MDNSDAASNVEENLAVKLFVGGLSWQTEEHHLQTYFNQFGSIENVQIMKDPFTLRSRGFGFITFSSATSLERVLSVSPHIVDGKKIDPKPATQSPKARKPKQERFLSVELVRKLHLKRSKSTLVNMALLRTLSC